MKRIIIIPSNLKRPIIISAITVFGLSLFYVGCIHHTEPSHIKIMRNILNGEMRIDTPGWNFSAPWVRASEVDLRPARVCVTSASKGFNCKLVEFNVKYWQEFVATQGYGYWWWSNRFSFNFGYNEEYRGMKDLMRGYAFATNKYRFIDEIKESNN